MKSKLFYENHYEEIAERIKLFLNEQQDFLSGSSWMIDLCDMLLEFYPKEIAKIGGRIERFKKIKAELEAKAE